MEVVRIFQLHNHVQRNALTVAGVLMHIGKLSLFIFGYRGPFVTLYGLLEPFIFTAHDGKRYTVPAKDPAHPFRLGFVTDGASFPWWLRFVPGVLMLLWLAHHLFQVGPIDFDTLFRAFWWTSVAQAFVGYPIHQAYSEAAVAHDYLYFLGVRKSYADCVFFRLIVQRALELHRYSARCAFVRVAILGYRLARAAVMYFFVALLGWPAYLSHRRKRRGENAR